ncbi:MAG: hypothetical protein HC841_05630 [Verrucomicrobiae bacterium]|nr:hypothetical protein [Verrucomicrobiae bacterium]
MKPDFQPDVSIAVLSVIALLNPAVILLGIWLGMRCDQIQKLPIAGFAAGLAGMVLVWLAAWLRLPYFSDAGRAAGGIFVAQCFAGTLWAALAYAYRRRRGDTSRRT